MTRQTVLSTRFVARMPARVLWAVCGKAAAARLCLRPGFPAGLNNRLVMA